MKAFEDVEKRFHKAVNMTAAQIEAWLDTDESKSVGFVRRGERESVGRQSAKKIIRILENGGPDSTADVEHMAKVAGYVARHTAQGGPRPRKAGKGASDRVRYSRWRYSLMNWGHDPLRLGHL